MGFSRQEYWSGLPLPSPVLDNTVAWIQTENLNQNWLTVQILREVLFNSLHSVPRLRSGSLFSVLFCGKVYFPFNFIFVEKTILFPLNELHTFIENYLTIYMWEFILGISLLWLILPVLCWLEMARVGILALSLVLEEKLSVLHYWVWYELVVGPHKWPRSCLTVCNPLDCIPPGSSVHGSLQARILEWIYALFQGIFPI